MIEQLILKEQTKRIEKNIMRRKNCGIYDRSVRMKNLNWVERAINNEALEIMSLCEFTSGAKSIDYVAVKNTFQIMISDKKVLWWVFLLDFVDVDFVLCCITRVVAMTRYCLIIPEQ